MDTCTDCRGTGRIRTRGWARKEHEQISARESVCPTCEGQGEVVGWGELPNNTFDLPLGWIPPDEPLSPQWFEKSLGQFGRSRGK